MPLLRGRVPDREAGARPALRAGSCSPSATSRCATSTPTRSARPRPPRPPRPRARSGRCTTGSTSRAGRSPSATWSRTPRELGLDADRVAAELASGAARDPGAARRRERAGQRRRRHPRLLRQRTAARRFLRRPAAGRRADRLTPREPDCETGNPRSTEGGVMATKQNRQRRLQRRRAQGGWRHPLDHRQPHRRELRGRDHRRDHQDDGPAPDQGLRGRLRHDGLRPGLHQHGLLPLGDHLHRRRRRDPRSTAASRSSSSASTRTYLEVAYLLIFGELPTQPQLERWVYDVTHHTFVHEDIKKMNEGFRHDAHPMGMLLASVGALSTFYPDASNIDDPEERYMAAIRLIAKIPTLAAFAYRHSLGLPLRLSRQRARLLRELPLDAVQDGEQLRARPAAGQGARRALHPPRRPRAELLDQRRSARSAPRTSTPTRRSPPASPRSTARCTAAPTRRCCGCCAGSRPSTTSPTSSRA